MQFKVEIRDNGTKRKFGKLFSSIQDFREPLERSGIYMYKSIEQNFQSQGRPSKWTKHSKLTQKLRPGGKILMDTGRLKNSVTSRGGDGKYILGKEKLIIGSNLKAKGSSRLLADIQQNGCVIKVFGKGRGYIPPRPFLLFQEEDKKEIQKIFDEWMKERLESVF